MTWVAMSCATCVGIQKLVNKLVPVALLLFYIFRCLFDHLKQANMCSMVGFIDPAAVSANAGTITSRSRIVAGRLQKTDGEQIFMMPYNPGLVSLTGFCFYDFQ